jgi:hypothetical protein
MRRITIESPYAGATPRNVAIAQADCHNIVRSGDTPYAFIKPGED